MNLTKKMWLMTVLCAAPMTAFGQEIAAPASSATPKAYPGPTQPMAARKSASSHRVVPFGQIVDAIEARPIFNNERNILSFPIGLGLSAEAEIRGKWSWTAELDHFQLGRKVIGKDDGFYVQDVAFERHSVKSTSAFGGLRYYTDPSSESFYAGARLGFRRVDGTYEFGNSDVLEVSHYVPLILESGYRIVASDNFTVRVGARVSRDYALSQQLQNKKKTDESLRLGALRYSYESIVDLGFGYYF
jgi:hypothetical protein